MIISIIGPYPLSSDCIHGGVESSVYGLVQALIRTGHTVAVFDFPRIGGKDTSEHNGLLTVHRYSNQGKHNQDAVQRGKEIFRDIVALQPDIVHVHGTGEFSGWMYKAVRNKGIPVVLTVHGLLREEKKQALKRKPTFRHLYQYIIQTRAEKDVLNKASHIIVDTPYVAQMISQYFQKGQITQLPESHIIPQGINEAYYHLSCDCQSEIILCVGAIAPRKGHIYTVEMFNILRKHGIAAKLRIIGALADRQYYEKLIQWIQNSPYHEDISIEINMPQLELYKAYEQARLFVLHSREESQGIVFAEAMAAGLPVVATNVGGIPDVVENEKSGMLCEFGDVHAMAENTEKLLTNQELWQSYSTCACLAATQYNWTNIADRIFKLYQYIKQN